MQQPEAPAPPPDLARLRRAIETGRAAEALPELDTLAASPAGGRAALARVELLRGQAFDAQAKPGEAEKAYALALEADPQSQEAAQGRGVALYRLGQPREAIPLLEHGTGEATYVLGLCYASAGRYDEARQAFARYYGFAPDSAGAYLLAARLLLRSESLPAAQAFAAKAVALDAHLPLAHELLGELALAGNRLPEAEKELEAEQTLNPLAPSVYDRLGDAYSRAGDYARAQAALEKAVLLEPNATGPYILLGKALLKQGDAVGAVRYLEHARGLDPRNGMTHNLLAQAYRAEGRDAEAANENAAAVKLEAGGALKLSDVR